MIECHKVGLRDLNKAEYGEGGGGDGGGVEGRGEEDKVIELHAKKTVQYYILVGVKWSEHHF